MEDVKREDRSNFSKKTVVTLIVFTIVLGVMAVVFSVLYAIQMKELSDKSVSLEKVYQRTFYDLVDSVNNTETKLSKLLVTTDGNYANNLLQEINDNLTNAEVQLSYLPISMNGIPETTKFINQLGGYTKTLAKNTKNGTKLSTEEKTKLRELYNSIYGIKINLNKVSNNLNKGYIISSNIDAGKEDYNQFTKDMQQIKAIDQDYPSMIYDGPFSESTLNKEIKGLNFEVISKEEAENKLKQIYENASKVEFAAETNGKFETFDFNVETNNNKLYVQLTKKGGKLLTVSSIKDSEKEKISTEKAIEIAKEFVKKLEIENMESVWFDKVESDIYVNLAPVINNVIIYPDLIKVKVDLATGNIIGYEATSYYTNHTSRKIGSATVAKSAAQKLIDEKYSVEHIKLALSPIDYVGEVLTYEFKCGYQGATYYIYINAQNGTLENILKVIQTNDGSKLM